MSITQAQAQVTTIQFVRDYPGALDLAYLFRENVGAMYGPEATETLGEIKGGYLSKETIHNGRVYRGRVDVPLKNMEDVGDFLLTLRHEVLGHYGANTFTSVEKRALLDGLIAAREEPSLKILWEDINHRYVGDSQDVRAEEVWALHCQSVEPRHHVGQAGVQERGQHSFMETCIARVRPMQVEDLHNIVCMVAHGLHDRSRTQKHFPRYNEVFRKDESMARRIDQVAVTAIQHVLNAEWVEVHTAGRGDLAERASLQFVAEQATEAGRPGFRLAGPEKYSLAGGLDQDELDALFRITAGLQAERTLRESVKAWAQSGATPKAGSVPPVLAKEMSKPVNVAGLQRLAEALQAGMARAFGESAPAPSLTNVVAAPGSVGPRRS
jgi:hypothetical protein